MISPFGLEYLPYQKYGIDFCSGKAAVLIGDEMGLGKTIQAIGAVNQDPQAEFVLVVCPASLKVNWRQEIDKWGVSPCAFWTITNYDQLHKLDMSLEWDLVVFDEAHYLKNTDAKRSRLARQIKAKRTLLLTGTPILNRPIELWHLLHILDPKTWPMNSRMRYALRYCNAYQRKVGRSKMVWDMSGASNLDELREILKPVMIRRTKAEVLTQLPPKRRQIVELSQQGMTRAFRNLMKVSIQSYGEQVRDLDCNVEALWSKLSELRHDTALAKLPLAIEFIKDALESSEKIVVFAHHRDVLEELYNALAEYSPVMVHGGTTLANRQAAVDAFQNRPTARVFIGQLQAAGVGLTLTAASHVIFVELDWVPGNVSQAEDRCHRIGQQESVLVQHLVLEDSLDALMAKTIVKKQGVIDRALLPGGGASATASS